jgi:hypothetical protein
MFKGLFNTKANPDGACYVEADGTYSNGRLHDEIMEGVPDYEPARKKSVEDLRGKISDEALRVLYGHV